MTAKPSAGPAQERAVEPATAGDGYHYSDRSPAVPVVEREKSARKIALYLDDKMDIDGVMFDFYLECADAILALIEQPEDSKL